jgi:3-hexulose-6-phosphate synthase / 6-phospho-3-hexuloisomerase
MNKPVLQVALDLVELDRALVIADESVKGGADWIEAGTPLIKSEGMDAVRSLAARFPGHTIVADMKVADTGALEIEMAAKAGAGIVCVLADADDTVIADAARAAGAFGVRLMADLINTKNPLDRVKELEALGIDIIVAHVGIDQQMIGKNSVDLLKSLKGMTNLPLAVAGGLDAGSAAEAVRAGAGIVIVGGWITRSADAKKSSASIRKSIDSPGELPVVSRDPGEEIREIFMSVSTPNISDAMHRKGAMTGVFSLCGDIKMVGQAITVQTFAGDWAKPVEAIDVASPGDVIVINNDGGLHVAPWGELATMSCMTKGVSGVVIDGAVRDVDDVRKLGLPVFARATVPNAGEPKGFGEINAEIFCAGQAVRPGDWVIGDESGVVIVPKERAYEIARRALEVKKTESRIREEIRRGKTLSQIAALDKWEKKK